MIDKKTTFKANKCCLILGGNSDIGIALAHRFAERGFRVLLTSRSAEKIDLQKSEGMKNKYAVPIDWVVFEGLDYKSHLAFYKGLVQSPDVVCCVFGYLGKQENAEQDFAEAQKIIHTNFTGPASVLEIIAKDMEKRKEGTIIGISSVAGERGRQSNYFYGAAKAAFSTYLSGLRNRLYPSGVRVISVKPGFVNTKMTAGLPLPKALTASPEQLAKSVWKVFRGSKNTVYVLSIWRWIMLLIRWIPESLFKRMKL